MRIAILWNQLSGYAGATFRALAAEGAEVFVVHKTAVPDAPFDDRVATGLAGYTCDGTPDEGRLLAEIEAFRPDALLVISWNTGAYRRVARAMQGRTLRILCMDNAWLGTPKQWAGRLASPVLIRPTYDAAFLPGERQAAFARRLGFGDDRILWGLYTCDHDAFAAAAGRRHPDDPPRFVFAGRLVTHKGVEVLAEAYRAYRRSTPSPWPLLVCGTGPRRGVLDGLAGVEQVGFVQPADLPDVFARATCLVLPSTFEPWGVVIHEATTAGLSVICTSTCGATSRLVLDGYNGAIVGPGDPAGLAGAMARVAGTDPAARAEMARRSTGLAAQFTPRRWARYLTERIPDLRVAVGLDG